MAKFPDLNSGRVYGPSHAHVVHVGSGNKHLYSVATVYHTDGEGNVTPHDTMHSSNKKGILSNIKRKYGSIPVSETMKESADIDSMDDISEDAGAYEQWDPKHPNFAKNYKKYKQNNPDGKLKDFVDHMKNKPTQLPEEYDIESMLEYIEQLESDLDEAVRITHTTRAKYDRNFGQKGTFQGDMERKHLAAAAKDRRSKTQGSGVSGFNSRLTGRSSTQDTGSVKAYKTEEYDIESMLEYIEELESALEESLGDDMIDKFKKSGNSKLSGAKVYDPKKVNKPGVAFKSGSSYKEPTDTRDSKSGKSYVESIESMLESVIAGDLVESKQSFADILGSKIAARLAEAKIAIAQGLFGIVESKDEDEDDEPKSKLSPEEQEKADDKAGAEFNSKHELGQLSAISSSEEGIPLKYPETVASGEPDKRSIRAATDRIKSGKSTSGVPTYKHANGEESKIDPKTAKGLHLLFTHPNGYKKDHKERLLKLIHSSKSGYQQAAKEIINDRQNPEKSKHKFTQSNTEDKART